MTNPDTAEAKIAYKFIQQVIFEYDNKYSPEYTETDYGSSFNTDAFCKRMAQQLKGLLVDAKIAELKKTIWDSKGADEITVYKFQIENRIAALQQTRQDEVFIDRVWAMPSIWTFKIGPIKQLLDDEVVGEEWADPFAGHNSPAKYTNDIEPDRNTTHNMDALEFLKTFEDSSLDGVIFDPPYSTEQCLRRYTPRHGGTAGRAEYWARCKDEIARIVKPGGKCISMCWDSTGIGKKRGFEITRIRVVCHGACHNDTIITVDQKSVRTAISTIFEEKK